MDQPPRLEFENNEDSNPMFIAPSTPRISKTMSLPSTEPRWIKHFRAYQKASDSAPNPKIYIPKSRESHIFPILTAIDTTAGKDECKSQTAKQWDTIIKAAKAIDKVSSDLKAARFFHFGHVVKDLKPTKPSLAYSFETLLPASEADREIESLPLPLGDYDVRRRLRELQRRRAGSASFESEDILFSSSFSNSSETPVNEHENHSKEGFETPVNVRPQFSPTKPERIKIGLDLSYPKYAAEEYFNDYELVKGIGRVPVNQKAPEPTADVDGPWNLSPGAWALKDFRYSLQKMISSDLNINNLMILPSVNLPTLDDDESLQLRWKGAVEQTITVFKDHDIKSFSFKDVTVIKYNQKELKIFFEFCSSDPHKPEELLLILLPVPNDTWAALQTCCYSLTKGQIYKQQCDFAKPDFFENKAKALMNLRVKRAPMIPIPNRHIHQVANREQNSKHRSRRSSRPLSQTRLNTPITTPVKSSNIASGTSSAAASSAHRASLSRDGTSKGIMVPLKPQFHESSGQLGSATRGMIPNRVIGLEIPYVSADMGPDSNVLRSFPVTKDANRVAYVEEGTDDLDIGSVVDGLESIGPEHDNHSATGLFYKPMLRSGVLLPVLLNDLVVRLRSESEREKGGRRDKLDIFDGPWRIVEFGKPKNTYSMKTPVHQEEEDGNASPSASQYDRTNAKKMLKTKVRLGFPRDTRAKCWVELSLLLPMIEIENVRNGKLHASCWPVTELTAFKSLQREMRSRNLEVFDPKYQSFVMKLAENISIAGEQTKEAENVVNDEAKEDGSEAEEDGSEAEENDSEAEEEPPMHIVEIKAGIFIAVMEADPKAVDDGDSYLVEKLRAKRLRLFKLNSPQVRKQKLTTDHEDPWVKRLLKEMPHFVTNRIVVSEYKVHWAGWADEDDTWDLGNGNIAKGFMDEFHFLTDIMRNISLEARMADPRDMIFKDDLPKATKVRQSGGGSRSISSSAVSNVASNHSNRKSEENIDVEMADAEEDIAISKAIQASLDEVKAAKTQTILEALQKEMGVVPKEMETIGKSHNSTDHGGIDSIMHPELDMDENDDIFMAQDDSEEPDCYQGEGGPDDGAEN